MSHTESKQLIIIQIITHIYRAFLPLIEKEYGHMFNKKNQELIDKEVKKIK